ncbi:phosphate signaling complex protein PhoU [Flavobacterium sp. NG2]|uniref:phosphate signaling complex protein PhoU n=1 Tax=Flavobacterium sp. NG2 TaxID=3097547 RepID=UPI002A82D5AD|nr:phosphate signaling complex protein PhoU [Flavobacterium sp. NG2]WPR72044.1 phosphate signaling complex protein PhoU [Flavobacterium sp. NG2]
MASHLETELGKLREIIIKIGNLAESQISEAVKSILSEPFSEVKEVKKTENKIDKLDVKIDDICQGVFALQQPVASDLRFIMSAMQISNEIERIGDLAMSIIKQSKNIKEKHELVSRFKVDEIAKAVEVITAKMNVCFKELDASIIEEIFGINNIIKSQSTAAIEDIIGEMKSNSKTVVSGTHLIIALKHMERIADHNSNVAESIYFMINAKTIKHEKFIDKK